MTASLSAVLGLGVIVGLGALIQSAIGFGLAVVAAPFVVLVEPALMPVSLLVCGFTLPLWELVRHERDIDLRMLASTYGMRLLFTPVGVGLVALLTASGIPARDATLATLAYRLFQFWIPIPAGAIAYVVFRRKYGAESIRQAEA